MSFCFFDYELKSSEKVIFCQVQSLFLSTLRWEDFDETYKT